MTPPATKAPDTAGPPIPRPRAARPCTARSGTRAGCRRDLVILFTSVDYDVEALYAAAVAEAAPAGVGGTTGGFTTPAGAARLRRRPPGGDERSFGVCHVECDDDDIAGSARAAAETRARRAGDRHPHSVLLLLTDGLNPDQREIARGAYEVTTAVIPFVGGAAGDDLSWQATASFGDGRSLGNGIVAVWINSASPDGRGRRSRLAARRQADARDPCQRHGRLRARRHAGDRCLPRGAGQRARRGDPEFFLRC